MKKLNNDAIKNLDLLIKLEIEHINRGYTSSVELGNLFFKNTVTSFVDTYLKKKYGDTILSMCSEYRYFVVGLATNVEENYKQHVIKELIIPSLKSITDEELLTILKKAYNEQ